MGQNPTSGLLSLTRRKEIYSLCQIYDILIIEDDPYWYLQYPSANAMSLQTRGKPVSSNQPPSPHPHNYNAGKPNPTSGYPFLDSLVPSYLHIDTDGRVIRLDTFSKTVAPGCRLGWITAQPLFIEKLLLITETATQQPSGFVQSMIAELIMGPQTPTDGGRGGSKDGSGWNMDGWVRWLEGLRGNYERRMQKMSSILEDGKYTIRSSTRRPSNPHSAFDSDDDDDDDNDFQLVSKTQMFDFVYPQAGMFLWMHIHFETHPLFRKVEHQRLAKALWVHLTTKPYRVLVAPGTIFSTTEEVKVEKGWRFFRVCFAAVDDDVLEKNSMGIVEGFKSFWAKRLENDIDGILDGGDDEVAVRDALESGLGRFWGPC
jgi:DNA-binding transcriptional MocR family regulator